MTHITLSKKTTAKPCLEFFSDGAGDARRVVLDNDPFRIGRAESADLRVESAEVSREHAEITERNGLWIVRDLGSTNGTKVNGKSITETLLSDGDTLRIAEIEMTFIASAVSQFQRMVTQPIRSRERMASPMALPPEVAAIRMMTEAILYQTIPTRLLAAQSLRTGLVEAFFSPTTINSKQAPIFNQPHSVGERYRELERTRALELATSHTEAKRLYVAVCAADIETPHRLFSSLKQQQAILPIGWELGITLSLPADVDILRITQLYEDAQEHELRVAFDEFQGNGAQVLHLKSLLPDYLILAPSMTTDLTSLRQPLRRLESLLTACDELAIQAVLPCSESEHTLALCQEIGFDLLLTAINRTFDGNGKVRVAAEPLNSSRPST